MQWNTYMSVVGSWMMVSTVSHAGPIHCNFDGYEVVIGNFTSTAFLSGTRPVHRVQLKDISHDNEVHNHETDDAWTTGCGLAVRGNDNTNTPITSLDFMHRGQLFRLGIHYCSGQNNETDYVADLVVGKPIKGLHTMEGNVISGTCRSPGFRKKTGTSECHPICKKGRPGR